MYFSSPGVKLEVVYPTIRSKLANALQRWHPSDSSAKQILTPWVSVFSKGALDTFLLKNIVPKLQLAMQELVIIPIHQNLGKSIDGILLALKHRLHGIILMFVCRSLELGYGVARHCPHQIYREHLRNVVLSKMVTVLGKLAKSDSKLR